MSTMESVGLCLQVLGVALAAGALVLDWRAGRRSPKELEVGRRRENPWLVQLKLPRVPKMSRGDRERWRNGNGLDIPPMHGTDPETAAFAEHMVTWLRERERLAAEEWKRQSTLDAEVLKALADGFAEQEKLWAATRTRIVWEGSGLVIALIGTLMGSLS